jgi:hypothetical protein
VFTGKRRISIMRVKLGLLGSGCVAALAVLTGCAGARGVMSRAPLGEHLDGALEPSVRVGAARVLDDGVNPLVPLRLAVKDGSIAVSFAHLGRGTSERIDPDSLEPRWRVPEEALRDAGSPRAAAQRIVLDGGRFLVCWTSGHVEWGHRAMAQMFNSSDGSPRGGPVAISPPSADVVGSPRAITYDGHRVVAMYAAMSGSSFQLLAVPIEDAFPEGGVERSVRAMNP